MMISTFIPQHFYLNAEQWEAFMAALEAPPREVPALERLMREPSLFERGDIE
jgi:uncharacterized protein (DUF1778 family)